MGLRRPVAKLDVLPGAQGPEAGLIPVHRDTPSWVRPRPIVKRMEAAFRRGHRLEPGCVPGTYAHSLA